MFVSSCGFPGFRDSAELGSSSITSLRANHTHRGRFPSTRTLRVNFRLPLPVFFLLDADQSRLGKPRQNLPLAADNLPQVPAMRSTAAWAALGSR